MGAAATRECGRYSGGHSSGKLGANGSAAGGQGQGPQPQPPQGARWPGYTGRGGARRFAIGPRAAGRAEFIFSPPNDIGESTEHEAAFCSATEHDAAFCSTTEHEASFCSTSEHDASCDVVTEHDASYDSISEHEASFD